MVHGTNRNADRYFRTAMAAAFLAGAVNDTIVVAPRIVIATDKPAPDEVAWPSGGDSWRSGGMSPSHAEFSSFDVADELLRKFADKRVFPEHDVHRRDRPLGRRPVRQPLRDDEQGARHPRRAGVVRRRQSIQLRVARSAADAAGG